MNITFYGAAGEVGRSCILIEEGRKNLLLDCGVKLGENVEYPVIEDRELAKVHNIFISHAHLDHSGYLPHIYAHGHRPSIFLTKPTRDMIGVLLSDYRRLQKRPLFRQSDVDNALKDAKMVEFSTPSKADFDYTLHNSGHIMGSAMINISHSGGLLYTGDFCMRKTRALEPCARNLAAKTLVIESTYGGKGDAIPSLRESASKLIKSINETLKEGGWVLIPSFAVGRAQEVLMTLDDYMRSGELTQSRIYVEGMINKVMRIYRHNAIYANEDIKRRILMSEDDPFKSKFFHTSRSKTREDVFREPGIIVSTSGMLTGGPALFYLEKMAGDPKNKIIFVGYQASGTLGRRIVDGQKKVILNDREIEINMKVESIRMSGHSDFNEIMQFIRGVKGLEKIFLIHGEKKDLKDELEDRYEVIMPTLLETYRI